MSDYIAVAAGHVWKQYLSLLDTDPVRTKALTSSAVQGLGMTLSLVVKQMYGNGKGLPGMNAALKQYAKFMAWGIVVGPIVHVWYKILDLLTTHSKGAVGFWTRLLLDQLIFSPILTALFFAFINLLSGKSGREISDELKKKLWPTMVVSWRIWPVAQYINFSYVPGNLRVLFGNMVGLCWSTYLAVMSV